MYITQVIQLMAASCDLNKRFIFFIHFFFSVYTALRILLIIEGVLIFKMS